MPQNPRRRDESPLAKDLRSKFRASQDAKDALKQLGGASPLSRGKLRRDAANAADAANKAAVAYRNYHQPLDRARAKANQTTSAQLDQFESEIMKRKG